MSSTVAKIVKCRWKLVSGIWFEILSNLIYYTHCKHIYTVYRCTFNTLLAINSGWKPHVPFHVCSYRMWKTCQFFLYWTVEPPASHIMENKEKTTTHCYNQYTTTLTIMEICILQNNCCTPCISPRVSPHLRLHFILLLNIWWGLLVTDSPCNIWLLVKSSQSTPRGCCTV